MSNVVDMTAALLAKRDEELRRRFGIEPGQTALPIGYTIALVVERTRVAMNAERARENAR